MKKTILIIFAIFLSNFALADHCLDNASNADLLAELGKRIGGGGGGVHSFVSFSCSYDVLNVQSVTSEGEEKNLSADLDYPSTCQSYAKIFSAKIDKVNALTVIAACKYDVLAYQR